MTAVAPPDQDRIAQLERDLADARATIRGLEALIARTLPQDDDSAERERFCVGVETGRNACIEALEEELHHLRHLKQDALRKGWRNAVGIYEQQRITLGRAVNMLRALVLPTMPEERGEDRLDSIRQ